MSKKPDFRIHDIQIHDERRPSETGIIRPKGLSFKKCEDDNRWQKIHMEWLYPAILPTVIAALSGGVVRRSIIATRLGENTDE